jgi:hypothetical protein
MWQALLINSEIVAWVSARAYLLAAFFVLLSALLAHRFLEEKDATTFAGYVLGAVCALLWHEVGILALATNTSADRRSRCLLAWRGYAPAVAPRNLSSRDE